MTVFYEHLKDQEACIKEVLSEKLPMNQLSPEELIRHVSSKQCTQCDTVYNKENRKVRDHDHETGAYIGPYRNFNISGEEHQLKILNKEKSKER